MKFAIPTAEGKLTAHFGHSQEFVLLHVEENRITKKEVLTPPPHEPVCCPVGCTTWERMSSLLVEWDNAQSSCFRRTTSGSSPVRRAWPPKTSWNSI